MSMKIPSGLLPYVYKCLLELCYKVPSIKYGMYVLNEQSSCLNLSSLLPLLSFVKLTLCPFSPCEIQQMEL